MKETRDPAICLNCGNKNNDLCVAPCQAEGQSCSLMPETLSSWELPPELPPFRELLELPAVERLALIYLAAVYERRERERA